MLTVILTDEILEKLHNRRIYFANSFKPRLKAGDVIKFHKDCQAEPYVAYNRGNVVCTMGAFSYANSVLPLGITIGRYCSIADGFTIAGPRHPIEALSTSSFTYDAKFSIMQQARIDAGITDMQQADRLQKGLPVIEHDVWIGSSVQLGRAINIGTGSVIAAHSVVTKNVEPYSIMGGNPAKLIRKRFSDNMIERLLASQWWDYKFTDFSKLDIRTPEAFLAEFDQAAYSKFTPERLYFKDLDKIKELTPVGL